VELVTAIDRGDVAGVMGVSEKSVGFHGNIRFRGESLEELRVFAITRAGEWGELGYPSGFQWNARYQFEGSKTDLKLISKSGRTAIDSTALAGGFKLARKASGEALLSGWALEPKTGKPALEIIVFDAHGQRHRSPPNRPYVFRGGGDGAGKSTWSGFAFRFSADLALSDDITVIALSGADEASVLERDRD
jgi:hypothetical protein